MKEGRKRRRGGREEETCQTLVLMYCIKNFLFADSHCQSASIHSAENTLCHKN